ncbi:MAG: type I-C CRISPR-associated protein Cas7/Csd2 [Syntrophorhabdaceae bacterium]|nr:type I-C CRISPR-associated protein Cas7/Csd2 [Syntrophorhabdaceae bacterium]
MNTIITNRHDILILFDVTNGNPNGDPDAGNMPRIDPTSNKGLVSDVCLKRKIRNYVIEFCTDTDGKPKAGHDVLIRQGTIIGNEIQNAIEKSSTPLDKKATDKEKAKAAMEWLCREFYDVRTFGGVLSVGKDVLQGAAFGQVRGPVQFTFAKSMDPITPLDISITRCAVTRPEDEKKERTMGNKHIVPYALYAAKVYVSPVFAERTGFTDDDLDLFFEALQHMFTHDQSAARAEMTVRGIYDFEHVGTQAPNNGEQNKRETRLGCYHAHKLFEGIEVDLKPGKTYPESFNDYKDNIVCRWTKDNLPRGVVLHMRHEQPVTSIRFR